MSDTKAQNRIFWENEELKLDERLYHAMWPGGQNAVDRLASQGKRPVRDLIGN
jgi:3-methylcrotonyl-CoA carboxylase beta subunit